MRNYKKIASAIYLFVGFILILGMFLKTADSQSEFAVFLYWILFFWAFPISYPMAYLTSFIDHIGSGYLSAAIILIAGYLQWFHLVPFLYRKLKKKQSD